MKIIRGTVVEGSGEGIFVYSKSEYTLESVSVSGRPSVNTITFERRVRLWWNFLHSNCLINISVEFEDENNSSRICWVTAKSIITYKYKEEYLLVCSLCIWSLEDPMQPNFPWHFLMSRGRARGGQRDQYGCGMEVWVRFHPDHGKLQFSPIFQKLRGLATILRLFISYCHIFTLSLTLRYGSWHVLVNE